MFKKKANNKKLDLQQQLEQITIITPVQAQSNQLNNGQSNVPEESNYARKVATKNNSITLEAMESTQKVERAKIEPVDVVSVEMKEYLNQIRNLKILQVTQEEKEQDDRKIVIQTTRNNGYNSQEYDDNDIIDVQQDLEGGFSPERDQDQYQDDYEDLLIKRTLTRHNYDNLRFRGGPILSDLKALETRDKLLDKIEKVSAKRIQNTIKRDLESKQKKLEQLQQQSRMKKYSVDRQMKQIKKKQNRILDMQGQMQNLTKIIQYIYYYGDKITVFEREAILKLAKQQNTGETQYVRLDEVE